MQIEHAAMYVNDLEGAKEFFVRYFEARANGGYYNVKTGFRSYFLSFDGGARLEIMTRPALKEGEKDPLQTGLSRIAFQVGSEEEVRALTERLRADGFQLLSGPRTTGDGYYESCVAGFEGVQVEITA